MVCVIGYRISSLARHDCIICGNYKREVHAKNLGRKQFFLHAKKRRSLISPTTPLTQNVRESKNIANTENSVPKDPFVIPDTLVIRRREENSDSINFDTATISAQSKYCLAVSDSYLFLLHILGTTTNPAIPSSGENVQFITKQAIDKNLQQLDSYQSIDIDSNGNTSVFDKVKDVLSAVLIADFFLIMVFLLWFIIAAALQSTYPVVLERFQDIFQPVVVPSLTVLMVGSIASGLSGKKKDTE